MENGDILLLSDGRMGRITEHCALAYATAAIQFIDEMGPRIVTLDLLDIEQNLGQTPSVLAAFYSAMSVHLRINRMSK